jgi:hypothetical protein
MPDSNFVIDAHPYNDHIMIASPCSGHGFKHSAAVGEALAEQVIHGKSKIDSSSFSMKRFKASDSKTIMIYSPCCGIAGSIQFENESDPVRQLRQV